jgi:hypothetical protein
VSAPRAIDLDIVAVSRGAGLALVVCAAAAVAARVLDAVGGDGSPLALPLLLVAVAGLVTGGWVAARACGRNPLTHAALAAVVAIGVLLVVNVVRQVIEGDDVRWSFVVLWVPVALASGLAGGLAALRQPRHRADSAGDLAR